MQDLKKTTESKSINNKINLNFSFLGLVEYQAALEIQEANHKLAVAENRATVLGFEHPAVLTLGYRADESHQLTSEKLPIVKIKRGGLATIHSEGQLVIYPVLNIKENNIGVRRYVSILLESTQQLLSEYGVKSQSTAESAAGLFTDKGKIAFCGIQIKNGSSLHGISLNVSNDLKLFSGIVSCGVAQQKMDRMLDYGKKPELSDLFVRWCEIFNYNILNRPPD